MVHSAAEREGGGFSTGIFPLDDERGLGGPASARKRDRLLLRGLLDEVGLDNLLASLCARGRSCTIEIRSSARQGEIVLSRGQVTSASVSGLSKDVDTQAALALLRASYRAVFDVLSADEGLTSRSSSTLRAVSAPPSQSSPRPPSRPPPPLLANDATDVALAAAVMNACGAYTRKWLSAKAAVSIMLSAWARISAITPALDAFRISSDGMVSVSGIERAKAAIPRAVASWVFAVFDAAAAVNPARFERYFIPEMLGGLSRLLEKGGFIEAFREGGSR